MGLVAKKLPFLVQREERGERDAWCGCVSEREKVAIITQ
jgi:hypothetical protein